MMLPYELCYCCAASAGILLDHCAAESEHSPTLTECGCIEGGIIRNRLRSRVPVVPVRLHNELRAIKDEVGLPAPKHRPMHLELQSPFCEFAMEREFDVRHPDGEVLPHPSRADLGSHLGSVLPMRTCLGKLRLTCISQKSGMPLKCFRAAGSTFRGGAVVLQGTTYRAKQTSRTLPCLPWLTALLADQLNAMAGPTLSEVAAKGAVTRVGIAFLGRTEGLPARAALSHLASVALIVVRAARLECLAACAALFWLICHVWIIPYFDQSEMYIASAKRRIAAAQKEERVS